MSNAKGRFPGFMGPFRRKLAAAVALVPLAVGACSSSSHGTQFPQAAGSGTRSQLSLGVIGTFSGVGSSTLGGIPKIVDAWAQTTNAAGGINGRSVEVIVKDIGASAVGGLTAAQSVVDQDHVAAIIDFDTNDPTWIPYAAQHSVPVIPGTASLGSLLSPDVFPVVASPLALAYAIAAESKTYGDNVAVGYAAEIASATQIVALLKTFAGGLGLTVSVAAKLSSTAPDYTAFCQQVKQSGATSYTLVFPTATARQISDQCYQQGIRLPQLLQGPLVPPGWTSDPAFINDLAVDGVAPFFDRSVPGVAQYRAALKKYDPSLLGSPLDNSAGAFAWAATQMFAVGAKAASGSTPTDIAQGLATVRDQTLGGLIAPVTYTAGKTTAINCWFTWKVGSGKLEPSARSSASCAPVALMNSVEQVFLKSLGK